MSEFNPYELEPFWESWYIQELLGEGSYGYVYKIYKEEFGKKYYSALKIIPIPRTKSEEKQLFYEGLDENTATQYFKEVVEVIFREIGIMAELKGRTNIVSFEDHKIVPKKDGPGYYLLMRMELLVNIDDYQFMHPFTIQDIVRMGKDVCKALILCGKHNIIHRDIKPGNIFVTDDGDFKLGDFGISRQLEGTGEGLSIKGTYGYMAPEVYFGKPYDTRADIYSLGMVLYYFLNKKRGPFTSTDGIIPKYSQRQEALTKRFQGEQLPKPLLASDGLAAVVIKACEYQIENRYATPEDFLHTLEELPVEVISDELIELKNEEEPLRMEKQEFDEQTIHHSTIGSTTMEEISEEPLPVVKVASWEAEEVVKKPDKKPKRTGLVITCSLFGICAIGLFVYFILIRNNTKPAGGEIEVTPTTVVTMNSKPLVTKAPETLTEDTEAPTKAPEAPTKAPETPTKAPTNTTVPVPEEYNVTLDQKGITDFQGVERIEEVTSLSAALNEISTLGELSKSIYLTYLDLHGNKLTHLAGLDNLTKLSYLDISSNRLSQIDELSKLPSLEVIVLSNNRIGDLQPLKELTKVTVLYLDGNKAIDDLSALKNWENLQVLTIDKTDVTDLSPLYEIDSLQMLQMTNTNIKDETLKKFIKLHPDCEVVK